MAMDIETTEYILRIMVIAPKGRLDAFEAPALRKLCEDYMASGVNHLVFDLREVTMIDSAGLAVLVSALKRIRLLDGSVRLVWPRDENAARILRLTKFDQIFSVIDLSQVLPKGL